MTIVFCLSCIPNIDMQKILEIAKLKNVGIWLYVNRVAFEENDIADENKSATIIL